MLDIGLQELIVIFVVILLVFGPKRAPELGKAVGKGLAELRRAIQGVKEQVETEFKEDMKASDTKEKAENDWNTMEEEFGEREEKEEEEEEGDEEEEIERIGKVKEEPEEEGEKKEEKESASEKEGLPREKEVKEEKNVMGKKVK